MLPFHEYLTKIKIDFDTKDNKGFNVEKTTLNEKYETLDFLEKVSKVNIFVGPNNTGKSRFLRALLTCIPDNPFFISDENIEEMLRLLETCQPYLMLPFKGSAIIKSKLAPIYHWSISYIQNESGQYWIRWYKDLIKNVQEKKYKEIDNQLSSYSSFFKVITDNRTKFAISLNSAGGSLADEGSVRY